MKTMLFLLFVAIPFLGSVVGESACEHKILNITEEWQTMVKSCEDKMVEQVQMELNASMTYMAMAAHFSRDSVNRPGFAKYFFNSASEEREHAIKIISYLLMRTNPKNYLGNLINEPKPLLEEWGSGAAALEAALNLETVVTVSIREIIKTCEEGKEEGKTDFNDYHLVDYLSGEFLEEQYKGQRELAGMISTLKKMVGGQGVLGEYLFDKKLLNDELF